MNELGMDPLFQLHNRKPGVLRPDSELGRTVEHADQELLGDMVRSGATVEHALDALTQHLDHSPVQIAPGLVLCQRPPVAWQLVERRETRAALFESEGVLPHRTLRVGGRKARLNTRTADLNAEGSERITHGRSRGRAPVGRQGLTLPGQQAVHHVTVRSLPARARLLEERAHRARRLRRGFSRRLRLSLRLGLRSRTCFTTSLAPALAAFSGQGALPALGSQRLLA